MRVGVVRNRELIIDIFALELHSPKHQLHMAI